jgi:hypothetical protein
MTRQFKWVLENPENEYYWTKDTGWTKKDIPDEIWKIVEVKEDKE